MSASELLGAASLVETVVAILVFVVLFGVLAMLFIVAIGNRADQDPTGSRPDRRVPVLRGVPVLVDRLLRHRSSRRTP